MSGGRGGGGGGGGIMLSWGKQTSGVSLSITFLTIFEKMAQNLDSKRKKVGLTGVL